MIYAVRRSLRQSIGGRQWLSSRTPVTLSLLLLWMFATATATRAQSLAEAARQQKMAAQSQPTARAKTYTNEDLARLAGPATQTRTGAAGGPQAARSPVAPQESISVSTPFYGDERYWKKRTADLAKARDLATAEIEKIQADLNQKWTFYYAADDPGYRGQLRSEIDTLTEQLESARAKGAKAAEDIDKLAEEGRKAGALPGWLRED